MTAATHPARPRWLLFAVLAAAVLVLDQLTKAWLVGALAPGESMAVIGDLVRFTFVRNDGALFGLFRDSALLFGAASIVVVAVIVWYHGSVGRNSLLSLALGLLLGGALGNLVDRLRLGYVVDFVDAGIGSLRFYTFNVADSAITVALLLLLASAFLPARRAARDVAADG
ncbi:MAG: signal peptidase II [Candidatus Limnocylindria bacterium]